MQMIYGSIYQPNTIDQIENEKENTAIMMKALDGYPWQSSALSGLSCGAMGVHSSCEGSELIATWGHLSLAADVRLDNRIELCTAMGIDALERDHLSDPQLILRAYRQWGTDCTARLLGDFAFALWDEDHARLFCARDFIGVRPFYYHFTSGRFIFASDLLALTACPGMPMQLNLAYMYSALQVPIGQFMHPEHTYYQDIEKLPPAHCLSLDANGLRRWAYWHAGQTPERRYADEQEYVEELRALLHEAVACRINASHPVGAHLSGGLDSSSVAVIAHRISRENGRPVTAFSWSPPLPDDPAELLPNDERNLVEAVRVAEGMPLHYTCLDLAHFLAHECRDITLQPTTTLQIELAVSQEAAKLGIHTMLSGWGGDELVAFNGRGYFSDLFQHGRWLTLRHELTLRAQLHGGSVWRAWIFNGIVPLLPSAVRERLHLGNPDSPRALPDYLSPDFRASLMKVAPLSRPEVLNQPGVRRTQIALLQHGHLSYRMESWASHGATLGLTYAFPLLDRRIVEFALSIPDYFFFKNGWKRYLYRNAMAGILPDSLRWNKKKEDPALFSMVGSVRKNGEELMKKELMSRADNRYIDIERLQLALNSEQGYLDALTNNSLTQAQRRRLLRQSNARRIRWLAFINSNAKI